MVAAMGVGILLRRHRLGVTVMDGTTTVRTVLISLAVVVGNSFGVGSEGGEFLLPTPPKFFGRKITHYEEKFLKLY